MSEYKFKINGKDFNVTVNSVEGKNASVTVNGVDYNVDIESSPEGSLSSSAASPVAAQQSAAPKPAASETVSGASPAAAGTGAGKKITSPLPGVIIDVCVKEGQAVKRGQKIAVIEAMKMENDILAESDGTVTAIYVKKTDSVLEGADIASIA